MWAEEILPAQSLNGPRELRRKKKVSNPKVEEASSRKKKNRKPTQGFPVRIISTSN